MVRSRGSMPRLRRLFFPIDERAFTYRSYVKLLDELRDGSRYRVVPLRDFSTTRDPDRAVVSLRHDVDERLDRALDFAKLEHDRGLPSTYFVLHTAAYWKAPTLVETLVEMQDVLGHEIGWHNDLVTVECVMGGDARRLLSTELQRLRLAGLRIDGTASHGSPLCRRYGYHNGYFFFGDTPLPGFPNLHVVDGPRGRVAVPHGTLEEFGFAYEAYHLDNGIYYSDAAYGKSGRRWHTDEVDLQTLAPGARAVILTHPDHWDASLLHKFARFGSKLRYGLRRKSWIE